jgi:hypothetical protein
MARKGDRFVGLGPAMLDAEDLLDRLSGMMREGGCLFLEHPAGHEEIRVLTGAPGAQVLKVITLVGRDAIPSLLAASLTIRGGGGGMPEILAAVSVSDGTITRAFAYSPAGSGLRPSLTHPVSGRQLAGAILPDWVETLGVAAKAARVFLPVQTAAWEIALTRGGPLLLRGEPDYDPPSHVPDFASFFGPTT